MKILVFGCLSSFIAQVLSFPVEFFVAADDGFSLFVDNSSIGSGDSIITPYHYTVDLAEGNHQIIVDVINAEGAAVFAMQIILPDRTTLSTDAKGAWTSNGTNVYDCGDATQYSYVNLIFDPFHGNGPRMVWPDPACGGFVLQTFSINYSFNVTAPVSSPSEQFQNRDLQEVKTAILVQDYFFMLLDGVYCGYGMSPGNPFYFSFNLSSGTHQLQLLVKNYAGTGSFMAQVVINDTQIITNISSPWMAYQYTLSPLTASAIIQSCSPPSQSDYQYFYSVGGQAPQVVSIFPGTDCTNELYWITELNFTVNSQFMINDIVTPPISSTEISQTKLQTNSPIPSTTILTSIVNVYSSMLQQLVIGEASESGMSSSTNSLSSSLSDNIVPQKTLLGISFFAGFSLLLQIAILIVIAVVILLILTIIICILCLRNRRNRDNFSEKQSITFFSTSLVSTGVTSYITEGTLVPSQIGLSIPGFLLFNFALDLRIIREITAGGLGVVSLAEALHKNLMIFGSTVIVKLMKDVKKESGKLYDVFLQEVSITYFLQEHTNIVRIAGYCVSPPSIILKYYPVGSLHEYLSSSHMTKSGVSCFSHDIGSALEFMHAKSIAHCDMKPQNILLDTDQNGQLFCVITDFGISQIVGSEILLVEAFKAIHFKGYTLFYAAPELLVKETFRVEYSLKMLDVYAYGVILFQLVTTKADPYS